MKISAALISLLGAASLLAGCATEEPDAGSASRSLRTGDCFHSGSVNGFTPRGDDAVDIRVGARRHYRLELAGYCPNVDWSQRIALRSRGGSWICRGMDAEIIVEDRDLGPNRCLVTSVRRLTDAEVEAERLN